VALPLVGGVPPTKPDGYTKKSKGLVSGGAGPKDRHRGWALEEGHGQSLSTQTTNEAKQKQRFKATSEEMNKRKQTLAQKKQKSTSD